MILNNHPYKTILESMVQMLQFHTQTTTLHKVIARANIDDNEQAYTLAKRGNKINHKSAIAPYQNTPPTPYYVQKDWCHSYEGST